MKKLELKIDRPCSEKWESFENRGLNGFCASCEKEVIDFTKMSDRQIKDYFLNSAGDVCGRMRKNQQKEYILEYNHPLSKLTAGLLTLGSVLFSSVSIQAQDKDKIEFLESKKISLTNNYSGVVSGIVVDETGEALPGVNVAIEGTAKGTSTDLDGYYSIEAKPTDILTFSYVGFETIEKKVDSKSNMDVVLNGAMLGGLMGEVVIAYPYSPRGLWWKIKGFFGRIF